MKRLLSLVMALSLVLGAFTTVLAGVIVSSAINATPAAAAGTLSPDVLEDCLATTSIVDEATNSDFQINEQSVPAQVLPGGSYTITLSDTAAPGTPNSIPSSEDGYTVSDVTAEQTTFDVPAGTTVTTPPTITVPGTYWNPATPSVVSDYGQSWAEVADANSPSGETLVLKVTSSLPGGDDYTTPTVTVGLTAATNLTSDELNFSMLDKQPLAGANNTTDPATIIDVSLSGAPISSVDLTCWPFPSPQPPIVSTGVIDAIPPAITIAAPGDASQIVQNGHVAAAFGCVDPPAYGDGIENCTATNDGNPITSGQLINTSVLGPHNLVVSAENNSGVTSTKTSHYTVIAPPYDLVPPTISLTSPTNGAQYITGSTVNATYSCADTGGSGLASCVGTVPTGSAISTTAGYHTFTVTALDNRGNPAVQTVGYYARTSNTPTATTQHEGVAYSSSSTNNNCSLGDNYWKFTISIINSSSGCSSGSNLPETDFKVTAPAANGGQLAVGDQITVDEQVLKPGAQASASNGGYYTGPFGVNFPITAPAHTVISGNITSSPTGIPATTYSAEGTPSASSASACNYGATGVTGTGFCNATPAGNVASTTSTASGSTTVGAFGSSTVGAYGSTSVGAYGSTTVGSLFATTVSAVSNGAGVNGATLHVASITSAPTSGHMEVATSAGTAVIAYTGSSTSTGTCTSTAPVACFTGVTVVSGSGTVATGGVVNQPTTAANITVLPVTATTGFRTTGTNQVTVSTTGGSGTATFQYTGSSTTAGTCGTTPCLTGVTLVSGSGTIVHTTSTVFQAPFAGTGTLGTTSDTGFPSTGQLNVTLGGSPAVVAYTGDSTTVATCGDAACFTGVTLVSGSGTAVAASSVTEPLFSGSGVLPSASVTGFRTAGSLNLTTSNGPSVVNYTGTATAVATCGASACFTGVTTASGSGTASAGAALSQVNADVSTFVGSGIIPAASVTGFTGTGSINAATSNGPATFLYTGTSTTAGTCGAAACFTGVTTQGGATGTLTTGGAITQNLSNVNTLSGATLSITSSTGFLAPGLVSVAVSGGTAFLSFTGTGTGTLTGATYQGGATGTITGGGAVTQAGGLTQNLDAFSSVAAGSTNVNVNTFTGSGTLALTSATATPFLAAGGTLEVDTTSGVQPVTYTGISGDTLTGVSSTGSGVIFTGDLVGQAAPTTIAGASLVNGQAVSGYNWSVPANNLSSFNVTWDDSSCQNSSGSPGSYQGSTSSGGPCTANPEETLGIDGAYIYLQYTLTVTSTGAITLPGLPILNATTSNSCDTGSLDSGTCWSSNPFVTTAGTAPGISWTAVDASPPVATLSTPIQGAVYANGQVVDANYACSDPTSGVTITTCTGVEDAGTTYVHNIANGAPLNTSETIPNQIHTFTVTATNSEGYTSTSQATFIALANPPALVNQTVNDPVGTSVAIPFNYTPAPGPGGDPYSANLSTEQITTPPAHGSVVIQPDGSFIYTNDNSANATDSFQWSFSDTAGNPSNTETVNINMTDTSAPTITVTTPPPNGSGSYAYQSTVDANYTCSDLVTGGLTSCTATQDVNGNTVTVADGSPIDTSSLIIGDTHSMTITAENYFGLITSKTVSYTVNTPAPVANNDSAYTINPNPVTIDVLANDTSDFPMVPSTVTVLGTPTHGTAVANPDGTITYTPTSGSNLVVVHDSFGYSVKDTDGQVSNEGTVNVTIYPVPVFTSVSPKEGVVAGGQTITVTGTGFVPGATTVSLNSAGNDRPCESVTVTNPAGTQLTCTTGVSSAAGVVDVQVTTLGGTTATSVADQYTYFYSGPSVSKVSPSSGTTLGGTSVTITGNSLLGATEVCFGTDCLSSGFTVNSNTSITATSPAGTAGTRVDITVVGPAGTSSTLPADQFTYGPQVTGLSPSTGPQGGGTTVTITGAGLDSASAVDFGAVAGTITSDTANTITAISPPGTGTVNVTVTTPDGVSPVSSSDRFIYSAPVPVVTGVSPNSGSAAGGTVVTITGNGFTGATSVCFGVNCVTPSSVSNGSVTATSPPGSGAVDVTVTTPGGTSATNPTDVFTYGPYIASIAPANGPTTGGTTVILTGTGLSGATSVNFGSNVATPTSHTATSITVVAPAAAAAGPVSVFATVGGVQTNVKSAGFTYTSAVPVVSSSSPSSGPATGGTVVTIDGVKDGNETDVDCGGAALTDVSTNTAGTQTTATMPPGTAGTTCSITITTTGGTSAPVAAATFTYGASVSHISPTSGLVTGGTTVTITGNGLAGASAVNFGSTAGTILSDTATQITVSSPAEAVGTVDITVVVGGVASPTSPADQFTYKYPVPSVGSLSPNVGVAGNTVTITGTGFAGAATVSFGANPGTILTDTSTSITVTVPAGTAKSVVDVTVTGPGGTSPLTSADKFTYGPVVTSVSPNEGSHLGGTTVTVKGAGFTGATAVDFGATPGTSVTVNGTGTQLTVKAPAGSAGSVDITVTAGGSTSNTGSADLFTYV